MHTLQKNKQADKIPTFYSPHYCSQNTFSREKQKYLVWDNEWVRGKRLSSNDIISKSLNGRGEETCNAQILNIH